MRPDDPDAVIAALMNRPVVQQERVDLVREYSARFISVRASGSPGRLALVITSGRAASRMIK